MDAHVVFEDADDQFHAAVRDERVLEGYSASPPYPSRIIALAALAIWHRGGRIAWPAWDAARGTWAGAGLEDAIAELTRFAESPS